MASAQWYVVRTHVRREVQVQSELTRRGVEVFLPHIPGRKKDAGGRRCSEPLFPCYLFSRLVVPSDAWLSVRSSPGVKYFLGTNGGEGPVAVPGELVEAIRVQCALRAQAGGLPSFKAGERVRICHGPFAGLEALFDRMLSPSGRTRVFIEFLSRIVPVELDLGVLQGTGRGVATAAGGGALCH